MADSCHRACRRELTAWCCPFVDKVNDPSHFSADLLLHTLHHRILSGSLTLTARAVSRSIADSFHRRILRHASARKIQLHHAPTNAAGLLCKEPPGLGTHAQI